MKNEVRHGEDKVKILNIDLDNLSRIELLEQLEQGIVFTPNVDHIIKLQSNREFLHAYDIADYKVCDSQILLYLSGFLGTPIREKISGSDLFPAFYKYHQGNENIKIFLLGGSEGTPQKAQDRINHQIEEKIIVGSHAPSYGFEENEEECSSIVKIINQSKATVLAIGVGAPKQEIWILKHKNQLINIKIFLAVGAAIDFEAGSKKRSPHWMSEMGFEWLYRLLSEPKRLWKRYCINDLPFFWLIFMQKIKRYKRPFDDI